MARRSGDRGCARHARRCRTSRPRSRCQLTTPARRSRRAGCWMPTRHGRPGSGRPRTTASPPALTLKSVTSAASSMLTARSTDQPLTSPVGSGRPSGRWWRISKAPRLSTRTCSQVTSTSRRSALSSGSWSSPRAKRLASLSGFQALNRSSTSRNQSKTRSTSASRPAVAPDVDGHDRAHHVQHIGSGRHERAHWAALSADWSERA